MLHNIKNTAVCAVFLWLNIIISVLTAKKLSISLSSVNFYVLVIKTLSFLYVEKCIMKVFDEQNSDLRNYLWLWDCCFRSY